MISSAKRCIFPKLGCSMPPQLKYWNLWLVKWITECSSRKLWVLPFIWMILRHAPLTTTLLQTESTGPNTNFSANGSSIAKKKLKGTRSPPSVLCLSHCRAIGSAAALRCICRNAYPETYGCQDGRFPSRTAHCNKMSIVIFLTCWRFCCLKSVYISLEFSVS